MSENNLLRPGQKSLGSGQVEIVGPRGGKTGEGERTVVKDKTLPPTPKSGQKYKPVDRTDNNSGF